MTIIYLFEVNECYATFDTHAKAGDIATSSTGDGNTSTAPATAFIDLEISRYSRKAYRFSLSIEHDDEKNTHLF
jgi:hypothetical protein